jgi:hypothetical protein
MEVLILNLSFGWSKDLSSKVHSESDLTARDERKERIALAF